MASFTHSVMEFSILLHVESPQCARGKPVTVYCLLASLELIISGNEFLLNVLKFIQIYLFFEFVGK